MIKITDVRIGNYYQWYADGKYYYFQIKPEDFQRSELANFEPIQLTEKILLKSGFKRIDKYYGYYTHIDLGGLFKLYDNNRLSYSIVSYDVLDNPIKYLHQLQNLYWCLVGKELNIEL